MILISTLCYFLDDLFYYYGIDISDCKSAIENLVNNNIVYIKNNITEENLDKLVYEKISNDVPKQICDFIIKNKDTFNSDPKYLNELKSFCYKKYNFSTDQFDEYILNIIQFVIRKIRQNNIRYSKYLKDKYPDLQNIDKNIDLVIDIITLATWKKIKKKEFYIYKICAKNFIQDINMLKEYIYKHEDEFKNYFLYNTIDRDVCTSILHKVNIPTSFSFEILKSYILSLIDFNEIIINAIITYLDTEKLFNTHVYDPYEFYSIKDKIGNVQYSTHSPYDFSKDRTSPIVVINDYVGTKENEGDHHLELIESYKAKHPRKSSNEDIYFDVTMTNDDAELPEDITETAVGSVFNKVVLLKFIQGDTEQIKQVLLDHDYKKVYLNNGNPNTNKEYKCIASLFKHTMSNTECITSNTECITSKFK